MLVPAERIINANLVTKKLGRWPDFHDFEVLHVDMDRSGPFITLDIYGFQVHKEIDAKGHFKLTNKCIITIRFNEVSDVLFEDFNHQNVLSGLTFADAGSEVKTTLGFCYGIGGYIVSKTVEVVKVEPYALNE
ncbi:MAG TPA: Imm50 family immunity protein [Candidatus Omnitrophota bacterium]|nr:Imm50 family immunity protein [Candidatus Omnitrophota bacterium]HRZ14335.1 Imm50 family immunity protein [Candidatus Omnitrophota bacterium]